MQHRHVHYNFSSLKMSYSFSCNYCSIYFLYAERPVCGVFIYTLYINIYKLRYISQVYNVENVYVIITYI